MARIVYELNVSLDGYVDHLRMGPPAPGLFRHFIERTRELDGMIYGRTMYDLMRYWDEDRPEWDADGREYAQAWRSKPKWVVSKTLTEVGPNATLFSDGVEAVREIKARHDGDIEVAGTLLAQSIGDAGLIDEYRLYFRPVVLGSGTPFFAGPRPRLRHVATDHLGDDVVRLTYAPA